MSDFTNINARSQLDPAGVQALLETLRKSQAWQDLDNQKKTAQSRQANVELDNASSSFPRKSMTLDVSEEALESSPNILSLLTRLQSTTEEANIPSSHRAHGHAYLRHATREIPVVTPVVRPPTSILKSSKKPSSRLTSVRNMAYGQALVVVAELASDASFHQKLKKIREQQNSLEKQLWEERARIFKDQEEKVKVAQRKATITGVNIGEKELNGFRTSFMDEIQKFDLERVSSAWDSLITLQQRTLEEFGVPGMFVTRDKVEREKQQRIIQVLEGLSGPDDTDNNDNIDAEIEQEDEEP